MSTACPMYFGAADAPLFGWFHPGAPAREVGVLLCAPWGREEVSVHVSLRHWAQSFSEAGWPCVRFDYPGEGDSAGDAVVDASVEAWVASVGLAIDELKRLSGVRQVCLLGVRLGATLACLAAQGRDDVLGLMAVAPVVKGRGFMRELTALQAAGSAPSGGQSVPDVFQSGGFVMSCGLRDALSSLDLTQLPAAPCPQVMVLDRHDMPPSKAWLASLQAQGVAVHHQALEGYAGMVADPHHVRLPTAMIEATLQWLGDVASGTPTPPSRPQQEAGPPQASWLVPGAAGPVRVTEMAHMLPEGVFGILTRRAGDTAPSGHAILLLNAGSTRRIGPSRMSVTLARRWCQDGHHVFRFDLAGVGDSPTRPGRVPNMSYPHEAMADVAAVLRFLQGLPGITRVHAVGLCSGAYHALKAARDGLPLASVTMINPLIYFNAEGLELIEGDATLSVHKVHSAVAAYKSSALSGDKWRKLLRGQVDIRVLLSVLSRRFAMGMAGQLRNLARWVHWPLRDDLGSELRRLAAAGVMLHFVFAKGDPGEAMLHDQAGSILASLERQGTMSIRVFDGADHVFTDLLPRTEMLACLTQILVEVTRVG